MNGDWTWATDPAMNLHDNYSKTYDEQDYGLLESFQLRH